MLRLEGIKPTPDQIVLLYDLLDKRKHRISHKIKPRFKDHEDFVHSHPYRAWLLVYDDDSCLGSVYVHANNTIGINIDENNIKSATQWILEQLLSRFEPLHAIKSVRPGHFSINVSPDHLSLVAALKDAGHNIGQLTFVLKD